MNTRTGRAGIAVLGAAALVAATCISPLTAEAGTRVGASGQAASHVRVVVARMSDKGIHLSVGHSMHAGPVVFRVVAKDRNHALEVARLHRGYSLKQAGADLNKAFHGDVKAIRRVDHNITFRGGAGARPDKPGKFAISLRADRYVLVDQNSNAFTRLRVKGATAPGIGVRGASTITAFSYGFGTRPRTLPASGWTRVNNRSDQPHFVVFNRVKKDTTRAMVRKYFKTGGRGKPSFALHANTSTGVISPYRSEVVRYHLPRGKYLIACFWPDDDTGMPHAFMGMWKLLKLS